MSKKDDKLFDRLQRWGAWLVAGMLFAPLAILLASANKASASEVTKWVTVSHGMHTSVTTQTAIGKVGIACRSKDRTFNCFAVINVSKCHADAAALVNSSKAVSSILLDCLRYEDGSFAWSAKDGIHVRLFLWHLLSKSDIQIALAAQNGTMVIGELSTAGLAKAMSQVFDTPPA